jgi:hypothetical protein
VPADAMAEVKASELRVWKILARGRPMHGVWVLEKRTRGGAAHGDAAARNARWPRGSGWSFVLAALLTCKATKNF